MGISPQDFRFRIGSFHCSSMKQNCKTKSYSSSVRKFKSKMTFIAPILMLVFCLSILAINSNKLNQGFKTYKSGNIKLVENNEKYTSIFCWAQAGLQPNKIQKIINGNRRSQGYKLAVWNCGRGLVQEDFSIKLNEIKKFVESKKPHCFAIIESDFFSPQSDANRARKYTTNEINENLKIDGYKIEFPKTWNIHGQARLICYVSEEIKYTRKYFDQTFDHIPSITLEIGLGRATKTIVHYYYREWKNGVTGESSPASQLADLRLHINQWEELVNTGRNFVSLGDANLCSMSWNEDNFQHKNMSEEVQRFLLEESCFQIVDKFTRVQEVAGRLQRSCIDHVTTNVPEKCNTPEVFPAGCSDHLPVMVTKYSREPRSQPKTIKKRNYKNFKAEDFLNDVSEHVANGSFDRILHNQDINEASAIFSGMFGTILNKHAPLKVFQVRNNYVPWISPETKKMIEVRDELQKEALEENCAVKYQAYKRLRNKINSRLPTDEINHYKTKFYQEDPSISTTWRNVNDYLNTSKKSYNNTPSMIKHNGQTHTSPRDIANAINDTFLDKVKDLCEQVNDTPDVDPRERLNNFLQKREEEITEFNLKKISKLDLRKLLKKRKGNRSSGIDYVDGYSIKLASPLIEDILIHLVNLTIEESEYPKLWKINKVSPQFKKGDKTLGSNWRPVTDLVFVSKLAEAAVFEQVAEHFKKNKLWHPNHHGFRPNHSTATALSQLYDFWIRGAEDTELSAALLLDLSAAFDVVDHKILLDKLQLYHFSPKTIAWFQSYLEGRKQIVVVESKLSDPKEIGDQGVPQGSLLGPILFLIFYNDFPDVRDDGTSSILYADDDTDNVRHPDPDILEEKIQQIANNSTSWVHDNKLVCSGSKTKLLVIGTKELRKSRLSNHNKVLEIEVDGYKVKETESERLLGLIVNNTMTWKDHLYGNKENRGLIPKLSQRASIIHKLSYIMPKDKLNTMAEGIFFSLLNYCVDIYGNVWGLPSYDDKVRKSTAFRKEDNAKLQVLVNKVLRSVTGMDRDTPISVLATTSGKLSVQQRTALFTINSVHRSLTSQEPAYSYSVFKNQRNPVENPEDNPRHQTNCKVVNCKLSISRGGYYYRGSRLYNQLPTSLIQTSNQSIFKKTAKQWVLDNIPFLPP